MPKYLNADTAAQFPANTNDGFARPMYGWSAFGPEHLDEVGGSSMTSNVWYGRPAAMLDFIEKLAAHYEGMKNDIERDDMDGVSLGYWEKDGLAMVAEFCTGDAFFEQKSEELDDKAQELRLLLGDGNDNNAGMILLNEGEATLDVPTRLTLAHFMNSSAKWVLDEATYADSNLVGFTDEDKDQLLATLQQEGASQKIDVQTNPAFEGKTFVVTGTMKTMDRHTIELAITNLGGQVASSITKKTFAVIAGPDASPAKLAKASEVGAALWNEDTFVAQAQLPAPTALKAKLPKTASKSALVAGQHNAVASQLLTGLAAINFPDDICDGFATPKAAWSSTDPKRMLQDVDGACMFSAVWVGSPQDTMRFAEALMQHSKKYMESPSEWQENLLAPNEGDGVAIAYWQNNGVAMCGKFSTWHGVALLPSTDELDALSDNLTQVLFEGNDNNAGMILTNEEADLDVQTRLKLAACMNRGPTEYVLENEDLPGFTERDKAALDNALRANPYSQFILAP